MSRWDLIFMSVRSLWRRKLRSSLTILGVIIGTTSIVLMISLALAMNQNYENQMNQWGALTLLEVKAEDSMDSLVEVEELDDEIISTFERLPSVEQVIPSISTTMNVSVGDYNSMREITVIGLDAEELIALGYTAEEGVLYNTGEQGVAIIGGTFTDQLAKRGQQLGSKTSNSNQSNRSNRKNNQGGMPNFGGGGMPDFGGGGMPNFSGAPGDLQGMPPGNFPGMGEEENKESEDEAEKEDDLDIFSNVVKLTYQTFTFRTFRGEPSNTSPSKTSTSIATPRATTIQVVGKLTSGNEDTDNYLFMPREDVLNLIRQKAIYEAKLNHTVPETTVTSYDKVTIKVSNSTDVPTVKAYVEALGYSVTTAQDTLEEMQNMSSSIQLILMGIGAISLIVSAIGITNTMMMSISERTKEIGVMKVIGAIISDIKQLFLVEAAIIGCIGGAVGVGFCYLISWLLNHYAVGFFGDLVGASDGAYETFVSIIPGYLAGAAIVFAALVGLIAGYLPAKRATALSALTALRAD